MRFSAATSLNCYQGDKLIEYYENTGAFEQIFYVREIHEELSDTEKPAQV